MRFAKLRFRAHKKSFAGKTGLEIGGPSALFERTKLLPVYAWADRVDGVNFSTQTVWEGAITEGAHYRYAPNRCGYQYVMEGAELDRIVDASYDFVLSSHSLEHSANALRAVAAWTRVLKPGGTLLIVVPNRFATFDHRRPVTTFRHLLDDFETNVGEDDLTHLDEIVRLHDLSRDPMAGTPEQFRERCGKNFENRAMHHHVFDAASIREIFTHFEVEPFYEHAGRWDIVTAGRKSEGRRA